jgi:hypothetical protein
MFTFKKLFIRIYGSPHNSDPTKASLPTMNLKPTVRRTDLRRRWRYDIIANLICSWASSHHRFTVNVLKLLLTVSFLSVRTSVNRYLCRHDHEFVLLDFIPSIRILSSDRMDVCLVSSFLLVSFVCLLCPPLSNVSI